MCVLTSFTSLKTDLTSKCVGMTALMEHGPFTVIVLAEEC